MKCVTLQVRQFFRLSAVVMALILLWRNTRYNDAWILIVAIITLLVDGSLFIQRNKECP